MRRVFRHDWLCVCIDNELYGVRTEGQETETQE